MKKAEPEVMLVFRIYSPAGRSRLEISNKATFLDLKNEIENRIKVPSKNLKLFSDHKKQKKITATNSKILKTMNLKSGDILYITNEESKVEGGDVDEYKPLAERNIGKETFKREEIPKGKCQHGPEGKCVNCDGLLPGQEMEHKCRHGPGTKCPNCYTKDFMKGVKHVSFEFYLNEIRSKCQGKHPIEALCNNCVPPQNLSYKLKPNCAYHKPFPEGICVRCMPQNAILKRQEYRHVDYVQVMNIEELQGFVTYWQGKGCMEQRVGYLYGYYAQDPNYPDGIRAVIEAIYEPQQIGDLNGFQVLHDEGENTANYLADMMRIHRIGLIFTSVNKEQFLTSKEIQDIARLQESFSVDHPAGVRVSKFITMVVKPLKDTGEASVDCYMVSDQCQALERDKVFGDSQTLQKLVVREPARDEMVPSVIFESKTVTEFEPDFFIVNIAHGHPRDKYGFNIIKHYDFPVENRGQTRGQNDVKRYLQMNHGSDPVQLANDFHLLNYLAEAMDLNTASVVTIDINECQAINPNILQMLNGG